MKFYFYLLIVLGSILVSGQLKKEKDVEIYVKSLLDSANYSNRSNNNTKAIRFVEKAVNLQNKVEDSIRFKMYHTAATIYFSQGSYYLSLEYYLKQLEISNYDKTTEKSLIYNNIGNVYWVFEDYKKAREYWERSIIELESAKNRKRNTESYIVYNNLAILERIEGNYLKALDMLKEYVEYSTAFNDSIGLAKAYQNISLNYIDLNDYKAAFSYLQLSKKIANQAKLKYDLGNIYYNLGIYYTEEHNVNKDSAFYYTKNAFDVGDQYNFPLIKMKSAEALAKLYERNLDYKQANHYLNLAKALNDVFVKDETSKKINQLEQEHKQKMIEQTLALKQKRKDIIYIASSIVLILVCIITLLFFSLQRNKLKRRTAENKLLAQQLEEKNKELTDKAIQMLQTNEFIDSTHKELANLKDVANLQTKKMLSKIIVDLKSGPKGFNKEEFEKLFKETHEHFYKNLLQKFPDLTRNEIRLCAFTKMNLSTKEISAITQQTPNSITNARYRLKKKLNLDEKESLTNFLIQF